MEFIEVRYKIFDRNGVDIGTRRSVVNITYIRRVSKTENGWTRIHWSTRVDSLVLDETYESFIGRIGTEYIVIKLDHDD